MIRTTLPNGLLVLLKEIHTAPLISSWVWYRVGSRDEAPGLSGISHWVEHMQFKGTPRFPAEVLDKAIARVGGVWNAFTYLDWTTYFETMPADKIDLALQLEADRMVNSIFDPQEVFSERTVIISEREGSENQPLFLLGEAIQKTAFRAHPYQHEVIGNLADLQSISREDLYNHYRSYYVPNNAVLAVAGDFETAVMFEAISAAFAPIQAGEMPPRIDIEEPPPVGEQSLTVEGPGETCYIQIAYRAPTAAETDFDHLTAVDSLLAGPSNLNMFSAGLSNKTSRLYQALVEKELAVAIHGSLGTTIDPYLYTFTITVHPSRKPEEVLAAFDDEVSRLHETTASPAEIERAIKQAQALFAYGSENITNQAFWLGHAEMFASYTWFENYLARLSELTPAGLRTTAQTYLQPQNRVVGVYQPTGEGS